jgi:hypothetical protein
MDDKAAPASSSDLVDAIAVAFDLKEEAGSSE